MVFEYLHGWRIYNLSGNPWQCSGMLSVEKVFPDVHEEPPELQSLSLAFWPGTGQHRKEPLSIFFVPPSAV